MNNESWFNNKRDVVFILSLSYDEFLVHYILYKRIVYHKRQGCL